ncbi:MAG TPA: methyltransferase domain-containing protein [Gemmatimonadales bacterium]|jgi:SAM-dependent methyltransferase|nr:methyltransferase domain-containing protein [Gemmatimonadales bacterium]
MTTTPLAPSPVGVELLDDPAADPAAVAESLRHIARANRWFGGAWAVRHGLARVLGDLPGGTELTLADLGTGLGDLPRAAIHWGARRGLRLRAVALERNPVAARLADGGGLPCVVGCAGALPFRDKSVDVVLVSQVAHHLAADSAVRLFRACDRLARRAVIVADLRRGPLGPTAFWVGARALGFDRVTVADGITSLRRGYTPDGLRALLAAAGARATVERRPGYRLVATWRPAD